MEALSKTRSKTTILSSGRAIDDLPLPEGAIGLPEILFEDLIDLFEDLIDDEVIKALLSRARKPAPTARLRKAAQALDQEGFVLNADR